MGRKLRSFIHKVLYLGRSERRGETAVEIERRDSYVFVCEVLQFSWLECLAAEAGFRSSNPA